MEDDEFDGDLGVHDEEVPRVLLSFKIEGGSAGAGTSQVNTAAAASLKYEEAERDPHQLSQISSINNWNGFNTTSLNQLLCPDEVSQSEETHGRVNNNGQGEDAHINNLEGKMNDLLAMLQSSERPTVTTVIEKEGEEEGNEEFIDYKSVSRETKELLDLEVAKSQVLEDNLKQAEAGLFKQEKLYEDLQTKSQQQFKQQLDMNKNLNEENLRIKQRINELEVELYQQTENNGEQLNKITQLFNKQVELNNVNTEKNILTVQNLEKVNEDLARQLENLKQSLSHEKELNQQLQNQLDQSSSTSKEVYFELYVNCHTKAYS